ncbi:MAG: cytidylate kinase-like family protein [Bacteroidales bacterium]|nr:cytidylate kinase-like family protein [Bacteroidales bacterium]
MKQTKPFVITVNRQLGSGGAYIGQQLADKLNIFYADREIISRAAKELSVLEQDIDFLDEKAPSFWEMVFQNNAFASEIYIPQKMMPPTDRELFEAETEVIEHIAQEKSAVIIGRCGFYLLRDHPNLVSLFLHADSAFRNERIQKQYQVSKDIAEKMLIQNDKERAAYCKTYTGKEWANARNYDLSINTGIIGVDKTVELILNYLKIKGLYL